MNFCTSCGNPISENQGKSCSTCFGDIAHETDDYYEEWAREDLLEHFKEHNDRQYQELLQETENQENS